MKKIFLLLLVCISLCACQTKSERYLVSYESFVNEVESNVDSYTAEDCEQILDAYELLKQKESEFSGKLSSEEMRRLGELDARFFKVQMKLMMIISSDVLKRGVEYGKGFFDGMTNGYDDMGNGQEFIEDVIDRVDETIGNYENSGIEEKIGEGVDYLDSVISSLGY